MSTTKVDHIAINGRRLRRLKAGLDKMIRSARDAIGGQKFTFTLATWMAARCGTWTTW